MKTLVVYDSVHGNTEKIARAIGNVIPGQVEVLRPNQVNYAELQTFDLIVIGAPTHGGSPTPPVEEFLEKAPAAVFEGARVATFDTRLPAKWVRTFGYAAPKIGHRLEEWGATQVVPPEGFFVKGRKGPLVEGELERAARWAQEIVDGIEQPSS